MSLLLEACALSHVYPDGSVGLDGCSLAIRSGSRNALLGSNGSGKTSLLLQGWFSRTRTASCFRPA